VPQPITPYLLYEDADAAVRFACEAFGFREVERIGGAGGGVHVELRLEETGAQLYVGAPAEGFRNPREAGRTSLVYVLVPDVDAHYERARAAGAEIVEEPNTLPFGHRRYGCRDPQGHEWFFAQVLDER
jgi:PhnB protein